jgi:hypothetical protein
MIIANNPLRKPSAYFCMVIFAFKHDIIDTRFELTRGIAPLIILTSYHPIKTLELAKNRY